MIRTQPPWSGLPRFELFFKRFASGSYEYPAGWLVGCSESAVLASGKGSAFELDGMIRPFEILKRSFGMIFASRCPSGVSAASVQCTAGELALMRIGLTESEMLLLFESGASSGSTDKAAGLFRRFELVPVGSRLAGGAGVEAMRACFVGGGVSSEGE